MISIGNIGVWGSSSWLHGPWGSDAVDWSVLVLVGDGTLLFHLELKLVADLNRIGEVSKENWSLHYWDEALLQWVNSVPCVLEVSIEPFLLFFSGETEVSLGNLSGNTRV